MANIEISSTWFANVPNVIVVDGRKNSIFQRRLPREISVCKLIASSQDLKAL